MRITNEDVKYTKGDPSSSQKVSNICADLLDARKIIDEQKDLIREMIAELKAIEELAETRTMKGELVYVSSFKEIRDLFEKSKDYV